MRKKSTKDTKHVGNGATLRPAGSSYLPAGPGTLHGGKRCLSALAQLRKDIAFLRADSNKLHRELVELLAAVEVGK